MATRRDFTLADNEDWIAEFDLKDEAGNVVPIAGARVHMQLRPSAESDDVRFEATAGDDALTILDVNAAKVRLIVRGRRMRDIRAGAFVYDIVVEHPTGRVFRPIAGSVTVERGITELQGPPGP